MIVLFLHMLFKFTHPRRKYDFFSLADMEICLVELLKMFLLSGNVQEKAMKQNSATNSEVIFYTYGIGSIYLFVILVCTGQLVPGIVAFGSTRYHINKISRLVNAKIILSLLFTVRLCLQVQQIVLNCSSAAVSYGGTLVIYQPDFKEIVVELVTCI